MTQDQVTRIIASLCKGRPDDPHAPIWGIRRESQQEAMEETWDLWKDVCGDIGDVVDASGIMTKHEFMEACLNSRFPF